LRFEVDQGTIVEKEKEKDTLTIDISSLAIKNVLVFVSIVQTLRA